MSKDTLTMLEEIKARHEACGGRNIAESYAAMTDVGGANGMAAHVDRGYLLRTLDAQRERIEELEGRWADERRRCPQCGTGQGPYYREQTARIAQLEAVVKAALPFTTMKHCQCVGDSHVCLSCRLGVAIMEANGDDALLDNTEDAEPCDVCGTVGGGGRVYFDYQDQELEARVKASESCPKCKDKEKK